MLQNVDLTANCRYRFSNSNVAHH